ncbi:MAG: TerB family tellurite resistance protein [Muribaculaceae bacterium]|nr:TerB family tellurite resistance protein [Muribaculaceae bacterium]
MKLHFYKDELTAIFRIALSMVMADGKVTDLEMSGIKSELSRFGIRGNQIEKLLADAKAMPASDAITILSMLTNEEKRYVTAFLGSLMAIDGVDPAEMKLWILTSELCGLPTMSVNEAQTIMSEL